MEFAWKRPIWEMKTDVVLVKAVAHLEPKILLYSEQAKGKVSV
jgi:hypothetical protein